MPLDAKVEQLGVGRPLNLTYTLEPGEIREAVRRLRRMRLSPTERRLAIGVWLLWGASLGVAGLFFLGASQEGDALFRWSLLAILVLLMVQAAVHLARWHFAVPPIEWPRTQLEIYEHTIAAKLPLSSASYSWAALANYGETRHTMVLDFNSGAALIIPKRLLPPGDLPHLRELILRKLRHSHLRV
jgi:hypothetical protein